MNLLSAVYALVHNGPKPAKEIAADSKIGYTYLLRAADDHQPDLQLQARHIAPLTIASGNDIVIKQIASDCGGVFYRLAPAGKLDAQAAKSLIEFGEYIASVAEASSDRVVTDAEFHKASAQAHEAIAAILAHIEGLKATVK